MGKTTVWDVYLKTRENCTANSMAVPINTIAEKLAIGTDVAEECAIVLQKLDLVMFNMERKEITLP